MTGKPEGHSGRCPLCSGTLSTGVATIPFVVQDTVMVVRDVPAEICQECYEPFLAGEATDVVLELLDSLRALNTEASLVSYPQTLRDSHLDGDPATVSVAQMA